MSRVRKMPGKNDIMKHWRERLIAFNKTQPQSLYFVLAGRNRSESEKQIKIFDKDFCFACGLYKLTQRCHIDQDKEKGIDDVENLHLLCKCCHDESEV